LEKEEGWPGFKLKAVGFPEAQRPEAFCAYLGLIHEQVCFEEPKPDSSEE
jgi:hypothetical protein